MNEYYILGALALFLLAITVISTRKATKESNHTLTGKQAKEAFRSKLSALNAAKKYDEILQQYGTLQTTDIGELEVLAVANFETGSHELGEKLFLKAFAQEPYAKNPLRLNLAKCWYNAKNYRKCIKYLQEIGQHYVEECFEENNYEIPYLAGRAFHRLEKHDAAIEALQRLPLTKKHLTPELMDAMELLAECYEAVGNKKLAVKFYNKVLANDIEREHLEEKISVLTA